MVGECKGFIYLFVLQSNNTFPPLIKPKEFLSRVELSEFMELIKFMVIELAEFILFTGITEIIHVGQPLCYRWLVCNTTQKLFKGIEININCMA